MLEVTSIVHNNHKISFLNIYVRVWYALRKIYSYCYYDVRRLKLQNDGRD